MSVEGLLLWACCLGVVQCLVQGTVCCCLGREEAYCVDAEEDLSSGPAGVFCLPCLLQTHFSEWSYFRLGISWCCNSHVLMTDALAQKAQGCSQVLPVLILWWYLRFESMSTADNTREAVGLIYLRTLSKAETRWDHAKGDAGSRKQSRAPPNRTFPGACY